MATVRFDVTDSVNLTYWNGSSAVSIDIGLITELTRPYTAATKELINGQQAQIGGNLEFTVKFMDESVVSSIKAMTNGFYKGRLKYTTTDGTVHTIGGAATVSAASHVELLMVLEAPDYSVKFGESAVYTLRCTGWFTDVTDYEII